MPSRVRDYASLLARFGYGSRGVVYILVGGLAVLAALGPWGSTTDSRGALLTVLGQPLGRAWLGVICLGLALFTMWRLAQSIFDADRLGKSLPMLLRRGSYLLSAAVNAGLAFFAVSLVFGVAGGSTGEQDEGMDGWADWLMHLPFGNWLTIASGLAISISGIFLLWQAWKGDVIGVYLDCPPAQRWWVIPTGRIGFAGRGVVFTIIGGFFALAGYRGKSSEARGLAGALDALSHQPLGWLLMGTTAAALFAFGLYGLIQAAYRRIRQPPFSGAPWG